MAGFSQSWDAAYPLIPLDSFLGLDSVQILVIDAEDDSTFYMLTSQLNTLFENTLTNSAGLAAALSDESGTGLSVFNNSPTLVTPSLGTPSALNLSNATGLLETGLNVTNAPTDNYVLSYNAAGTNFTWVAESGGSSVITDLTGTAHRILYIDGSGDVTELAYGADGTVLTSTGASTAPSFESVSGTGDLLSTNNLSDVASAATSRTNLDVYSKAEVSTVISDSLDALLAAGEPGVALADSSGVAAGTYVTGWDFAAGQALKANLASPTFTGVVTVPTPFTIGSTSMTATATELNILDGATLSTAELNYVDGVTSNIQDQINGLGGGHDAVTLAGAYDYLTLTDQEITRGQIDLTTDVTGVLPDANVANDITITNISQVQDITATAAEVNYTTDVTSNIQAQIDLKASPVLDINAQTGTTYTLQSTDFPSDAEMLVTLTNAAAITLTVPTNATTSIAVGSRVHLANGGAGTITVGGAGITWFASITTLDIPTGKGATLIKTATDTWWIVGGIE